MKKAAKSAADTQSDVMTLRGAAEYLACDYATIFRLVITAELPAFRLDGDWRFHRSELNA
jgi:excisionase family DNA binding protein